MVNWLKAAATLPAPADIPLRTKEQWKYIGKGVKTPGCS